MATAPGSLGSSSDPTSVSACLANRAPKADYEFGPWLQGQDKGDIPKRMMTPNTERIVQQAAKVSA